MSKFGHRCGYLIVSMIQSWWEMNLTLLDTVCCNRCPVPMEMQYSYYSQV